MLRPPDAFPRTDKGWFFFIFLSSSPRNLQALPHGAQESWVRMSGRALCPSLSHDTAGQWSVPSSPGWHPHRWGPCSRLRTQESGTLPPALRPREEGDGQGQRGSGGSGVRDILNTTLRPILNTIRKMQPLFYIIERLHFFVFSISWFPNVHYIHFQRIVYEEV